MRQTEIVIFRYHVMGQTQADVARSMGISQGMVSRILKSYRESGDKISSVESRIITLYGDLESMMETIKDTLTKGRPAMDHKDILAYQRSFRETAEVWMNVAPVMVNLMNRLSPAPPPHESTDEELNPENEIQQIQHDGGNDRGALPEKDHPADQGSETP